MDITQRIIAITPLERPDSYLVTALQSTGALAVLDLGRDEQLARRALMQLASSSSHVRYGVRVGEKLGYDPTALAEQASVIVLSSCHDIDKWPKRTVLVQVTSLDEAKIAVRKGAAGLIAKGFEAGGRVGEKSAYVLLQQLVATCGLPIWVQGGIGLHTAAASICGGAAGVVIDSQLALTRESSLDGAIKKAIRAMDGSEARVIAGHRLYVRGDLPLFKLENSLSEQQVLEHLGAQDLTKNYLPIGQEGALADKLTTSYGSAAGIVRAINTAIDQQIKYAAKNPILSRDSALAKAHGMAYPIVQGPMSRVSDNADFAAAVAEAGGMPLLALSVMKPEDIATLLQKTAEKVARNTWGVGLLGFLPPEFLHVQMDVVKKMRPRVALLAGGTVAQVKELEKEGIATFVHAPTVQLLDMFLKEGARKFVFEGRECGGHVGPFSSFFLWETVIVRLKTFERPADLHLLFAGGVHDDRSAAMIAALTAPLAEQGAKIGVLIGTAYLFTREAVSTGAIMPLYQQMAIECASTVELTTAPGHSTRCIGNAYTQVFAKEKEAMKNRGEDPKVIHRELEKLNLGRLRIAAKGEVHEGETVIRASVEQQQQEGMFMVGQAVALKKKVVTLSQLHEEIAEGAHKFITTNHPHFLGLPDGRSSDHGAAPVDIAIIGMACIYPDAKNVDEFWQNILQGKSLIKEVPADRWSVDLYYDPSAVGKDAGKKTPSKWGGFIPTTEINPADFGIPPKTLLSIEPIQILSLKVARDALEDSGYLNRTFDRTTTAVYFGASTGTDLSNAYGFRALYPKIFGSLPADLDEMLPKLTEDSFPGILPNIIAGRISNRLDLRGASCTVDAACASSMAALNYAVKDLITHTSDMVLCGGADLQNTINDYLLFASVHALSSRDKCSPFDENADGTVLGEGIACVVLKRLDDARRDGDRIYAVVKSIGTSSDGRNLGITAPTIEGQTSCLTRAYQQAGMSPHDIGLIEAHGTGTVVGDKAELTALTQVFEGVGAKVGSCALGSVKSQIGHTKRAAGLAGIIKVSKAIYHGTLPPTANIQQPNACYKPETSPFLFSLGARPWPSTQRNAGISAFGFGGANFHAIIAADEQNAIPSRSPTSWPSELCLLRGNTRQEALTAAQGLQQNLVNIGDVKLADVAFTLSSSGQQKVQIAIVAKDIEDLKQKLTEIQKNAHNTKDIFFASEQSEVKPSQIAFLFPGQGSQRPHMAADLFVMMPRLQKYLTLSFAGYGTDLVATMYPAAAFSKEQQKEQVKKLKNTKYAQSAIGIMELALADLLRSLGVEAGMAAGHSYGELAALCFAGVIAKDDLLPITLARIDSILKYLDPQDPGTMAAVFATLPKINEVLGERLAAQQVAIANINAPDQIVITGKTPQVEEAVAVLKNAQIEAQIIPVSCAFHSPALQPAADYFEKKLAPFTFKASQIPVWSNKQVEPYSESRAQITALLSQQIPSPVRFKEQIEAMYEKGARVFIEVGPGNVLTNLVGKILAGHDYQTVTLDQSGEGGLLSFLRGIAKLAALGVAMDTRNLYVDRAVTEIDFARLREKRVADSKLWLLDGAAAWPKVGSFPLGCLKNIGFLRLNNGTASVNGEEQLAISEYLVNMRQITKAQRDVMMAFLGVKTTMVEEVPTVGSSAGGRATLKLMSQTTPAASGGQSTVVSNKVDVRQTLLRIVSEKTGYPEDMLGLDLDLEADLSIDSIKRIEILSTLKEQLNLSWSLESSGPLLEQTSQKKTLRGIIEFLESERATAPSTPDQAGISASIASLAEAVHADVVTLLRDIISEKTGYPTDMLDIDLDLEADLSIDSIKRIEVMAVLRTTLKLEKLDLSSASMAEIEGKKTIRSIAGWFERQMGVNTDANPAEVSTSISPSGEMTAGVMALNAGQAPSVVVDTPIPISRYVMGIVEQPLQSSSDLGLLRGHRIVITQDNKGVADKLMTALLTHGAQVIVWNRHDNLPSFDSVDMLIDIAALYQAGSSELMQGSFACVKAALAADVKYLIATTGYGGLFGHDGNLPNLNSMLGLTGVFKTISHEYDGVFTKVIDLNPSASPDELVSCVLNEIELGGSGDLEVGYNQGKRYIRTALPDSAASVSQPASFEVDEHSVIVVTGGARGITARTVIELARRYKCTFELIGRSPLPSTEQDNELLNAASRDEMRKILIGRGLKQPAEIERMLNQMVAAREITATLAAIGAVGGKFNYHTIDVRRQQEFAELIDQLYAKYGKIDGFIHGAGILEDKFIKDKTVESFIRVYETKVVGAGVIAQKAKASTKFVLFFSSVAGAFGNRGQVDYAAANDAMDRIAWWLNQRIKGRCLSVNFGPWRSSGMVTPELEREYYKRGIGLIPLDEGVTRLLGELQGGSKDQVQVVLMCADLVSLGLRSATNQDIDTSAA